jgi:hypothetical protein
MAGFARNSAVTMDRNVVADWSIGTVPNNASADVTVGVTRACTLGIATNGSCTVGGLTLGRATPYRGINRQAGNRRRKDWRVRLDRKDFLKCPRHAGALCPFQCTRLIITERVRQNIECLPDPLRQTAASDNTSYDRQATGRD